MVQTVQPEKEESRGGRKKTEIIRERQDRRLRRSCRGSGSKT
jgi:hypothetical protein